VSFKNFCFFALGIRQQQNGLFGNKLAERLFGVLTIDGFYQLFVLDGPYVVKIISKKVEQKYQYKQDNRYAYLVCGKGFSLNLAGPWH